ncbi:MAG: 8-amino-7-oxononanoate synthase [Bacteroidetes bacterium QH_2_67_10]|nr:MAG: 8-amino-7-oxononanoate synthase [Bacteroidetes bacterium QH_2_67_10]
MPDVYRDEEEHSPPTTPASPEPSLFEKCHEFTDESGPYAQAKAADLYPYFRPIERNEGTTAIMNGDEVIMAGSNNYLGLTSDKRVKEAAREAVSKYGTGCTGSRFLNGTLDLHLELEERLADFLGRESCVLFSTGYMTNEGVVQGITSKGDYIFSDKGNHACIVAGTKASLAETRRYRHDDMDHLRTMLERAHSENPDAGKLIATDGVFSMSGTIAQVPELLDLAEEFDAALMLDDAHAVGVVGPGGRGSAATFGEGPMGRLPDVHDVIEYLRHEASTHIFSASMPPASVATVLKCLEILQEEPERLERLWEISDYMRSGFRELGFDVWTSQSPIIPVVVGDMETCFRFWRDLIAEGVFVNAVVPPAVRPGQCLMRTSYMATHSDEELDHILDAFERVGAKHGVIGGGSGADSGSEAIHANGRPS